MFLLQNKGIEYVDMVQEGQNNDVQTDSSNSIHTTVNRYVHNSLHESYNYETNNVAGAVCNEETYTETFALYLECTAAKSVEHSGFNSEQIQNAIQYWTETTEHADIEQLSGESLMDILIRKYEHEEPLYSDTRCSCSTNGSQSVDMDSPVSTSIDIQPPNNTNSVRINKGDITTDDTELDALIQAHAKEKEDEMCSVCKDEPKEIALLPCGDVVACRICSMALYDCPKCNQRVKATVRVYYS